MSFWHSIIPDNTPLKLAESTNLTILRERTLQYILLFIISLGLPAAIYLLVDTLLARRTFLGGSIGVMIIPLLLIAFFRNVSYLIRAMIFLGVIFLFGLYVILGQGYRSEGSLVLFALIILTGILINLRGAILVLLLSILALFDLGVANLYGIQSTNPNEVVNAVDFVDILSTAGIFTLLAIPTTFALSVLLNNLQADLVQQIDISDEISLERESLEKHVQQRTQDLERRLVQIRTAAEISRSISSLLNLEEIMQNVVDLIRDRNNYYYVGIFLVDEKRENAILMAGTGEAGRKMIAGGHRLQVGGSSMIGWATANRQARIALDAGAESIRFNNPYLPLTRSEMALPIVSRGDAIGALTVQSSIPNAFDESDIVILEGITDSLAIAIDNARLFKQSQNDLSEIRVLNRQFLQQAWKDELMANGNLGYSYQNPVIQESEEFSSRMFPITIRDQVIGNLTIESSISTLTTEDREMVETIINQTALALESARLLAETQRRVNQEEKINTLSAELGRGTTIEQILKTAIQELGKLPSVTEVTVHLEPGINEPSTEKIPPAYRKNGNIKFEEGQS